jgi:hypothetical protein
MMTTPAHGNFPESSAKLEGGFEASGLSPDEAERFAAAFKPSWEFDEAPFAEGGAALRNGDLDGLEAGGVREVHRQPDSARAYTAAAHAPPARVETHEPEVSVIIDRSITAAPDVRAPVAAVPASVAAPLASAAAPAVSPNRVVAPVARSRFNADESLELPTSLKKSNKGLFIGLGAAVTAAVLVFAVRAAMSSPDEPAPAAAAASTTAISAAAPAKTATGPSIPPPPPPAPPVATPPVTQVSSLPPSRPVAAPPPAAAKPASHAAAPPPVHHAPPAPRSTPKPASGGIVRDVPF